jgi:hypothetical protein
MKSHYEALLAQKDTTNNQKLNWDQFLPIAQLLTGGFIAHEVNETSIGKSYYLQHPSL